MLMSGLDYVGENMYLYQQKEFFDDYGLNLHYFNARMFDSELGRFHSNDPKMVFASPYNGMGNNPISLVDPNGMNPIWYWAVINGVGGFLLDEVEIVADGSSKVNEINDPYQYFGIHGANLDNSGGSSYQNNDSNNGMSSHGGSGGNGGGSSGSSVNGNQGQSNGKPSVENQTQNVEAQTESTLDAINDAIVENSEILGSITRMVAIEAAILNIAAYGIEVGTIGAISNTATVANYVFSATYTYANYSIAINNPTAGNWGRAGITTVSLAVNLVDHRVKGLGSGISVVINTADIAGVFDPFYDWLDDFFGTKP